MQRTPVRTGDLRFCLWYRGRSLSLMEQKSCFILDLVASPVYVLHIPLPFISAVAVTLVEFVGGTALVLGAVTRWAAALIAMDMSVAVLMVHRHLALFHKGGIELPLILLASCVALALSGPGAASLDGAIRRKNS
jgi:putative oxidoreductase